MEFEIIPSLSEIPKGSKAAFKNVGLELIH